MSTFLPGQVVKIHRPNKANHGWQGRYVGTEGALPGSAYVSFRPGTDQSTPPEERFYKRSDHQFKMLPLSQIQAV